ncbi:hypothetical protein KFL_011740030 [Klebsormidium nitens]|uniref:F-box domain-containing protein n=1 Tax=Klebsormidium nitens TaxID=105231 RepID=A0A1Y1IVX3_KLENI|nr:hypothetical protein KFL_011740030 [Klebsormidium nitens]|eukprot:GAQ92867.1 hypothetical protein KFL_011740030 [Klebsormidium nitens]
MPVDVLRLILKDFSLKERLRLEILDKSHRDALRDPELWHAIKLGAVDAQTCTEDQLLSLLIRLEPRMQRGAARIRRMAESLSDVTEAFMKHRMAKLLAVEQLKRKTRASFCREAIFLQLMSLRYLHTAVPESWTPVRFFLETCTLWVEDQLQRIPLAVRSVCNFLRNVRSSASATFVRSGTSSPTERPERQRSAKRELLLNVSGAVQLSPNFVAACAIALSAAGFQVTVRMVGDGDPGFLTNNPVLDVIRSLALDCAFLVNLKVSGTYPWKPECLAPFNPWGPAQEPFGASEAIETKLERVAASVAPHFDGSKAAFQRFLRKVASVVEQRAEIAAVPGGGESQTRGATAEVYSYTVILEHLVTHLEEPLLEELGRFLRDAPSAHRVVVRNCMLSRSELRSLSAVLGEGDAGTVTFQHLGHDFSRNNGMARPILTCAELQASQDLQALALDFPLTLADLDSVALFLERNADARVVIHLRPAFYAQSAAAARQLFAKVSELCASGRGRVVLALYPGAGVVPSGTNRERAAEQGRKAAYYRGGCLGDAFLTSLQQEIQSPFRFEEALRAADRVIWGICVADVIFGLVLSLDSAFFGVRLFGFASELGIPITVQVFVAALSGWPSLRAAIQGERDPIDMGIVVFSVGLFPFLPFGATWRVLYFYLCACLAWTVLKWTGKIAVGCFHWVWPKIEARGKSKSSKCVNQ